MVRMKGPGHWALPVMLTPVQVSSSNINWVPNEAQHFALKDEFNSLDPFFSHNLYTRCKIRRD